VAKATLDTSAVSDTVRVSWKIVGFLKAKHPPAATHITAVGKEAVVLAKEGKEERVGGLGHREEKDRPLPVEAVRVAHPRVAAVEVPLEVDHHREEEVVVKAVMVLPLEVATAHRREVATGLPLEAEMGHRREAMATTVEGTMETTIMAVMGTTTVTEGTETMVVTETTTMEETETTMMEAAMAATTMEPRTMIQK